MKSTATIVLLFFFLGLNAQSYWKSYSKKDGLIDNNVRDIAASEIRIYLATENGFSVFENERFTNYDTSNSNIASQNILSIREFNDTVYMITDNGLTIYHDQVFENYTDTNGLISNQLTDIEVDSKGELWIASLDGLVRKVGSQFIHDSTRKVFELGINSGDSVYAVVNFHTLINVSNPITVEIFDGSRWQSVFDPNIDGFVSTPRLVNLESGRIGIISTIGAKRIYEIKGVFVLDSISLPRVIPEGLNVTITMGNDIASIDNGDYWISFKRTSGSEETGGLIKVDSTGYFYYSISLPTLLLNCVEASGERIIIGTESGFAIGSDTLKPFPRSATLNTSTLDIKIIANGGIGDQTSGFNAGIRFLNRSVVYSANTWHIAKRKNSQFLFAREGFTFSDDFNPGSVGTLRDDLTRPTLYSITKEEINFHLNNRNKSGYKMIDAIRLWPSNGDPIRGESPGIAPFVDLNNNGCYDPENGDYPAILGDKAVYTITNDANGKNFFSLNDIEIEVHMLAYVFDSSGIDYIDNSVFLKYYLFNRSQEELQLKSGLYLDFDIGFPGDDYFGSVPSSSILYAYNGDSFDGPGNFNNGLRFDNILPAVGVKSINKKLTSASPSISIGSVSDNTRTSAPRNTLNEFVNRFNGRWNDGVPFTRGGDGYDLNSDDTTKFLFSGDPSIPNSWVMDPLVLNKPVGDINAIGVGEYIEFKPDEFIELDYVISVAYDSTFVNDNVSAIALLKDNLNKASRFQQGIDSIRPLVTFANCPVGEDEIKIEKFQGNKIFLYPNPAINQLNIIVQFTPIDIMVYDIQGREVLRYSNLKEASVYQIDISSIKKEGIYFIRIQGAEGELVSSSFIVNK